MWILQLDSLYFLILYSGILPLSWPLSWWLLSNLHVYYTLFRWNDLFFDTILQLWGPRQNPMSSGNFVPGFSLNLSLIFYPSRNAGFLRTNPGYWIALKFSWKPRRICILVITPRKTPSFCTSIFRRGQVLSDPCSVTHWNRLSTVIRVRARLVSIVYDTWALNTKNTNWPTNDIMTVTEGNIATRN